MKSSRNTSTSGKPASGRRTPARKTKAKKKTTRTMPVWMRNTLALIVVGVFSLTFYYFVIRPYSYRWKECYGRKEYGVCIPCGYEGAWHRYLPLSGEHRLEGVETKQRNGFSASLYFYESH